MKLRKFIFALAIVLLLASQSTVTLEENNSFQHEFADDEDLPMMT